MYAQTTDSGSNNATLASELEEQFAAAPKPVEWKSKRMQIQCIAHKLALVVKDGLKLVNLSAGHIKPTTPHSSLPTFTLNEGQDKVDIPAEEDSDCEGHGIHVELSDDKEGNVVQLDEDFDDWETPPTPATPAMPLGGWKEVDVRLAVCKVN